MDHSRHMELFDARNLSVTLIGCGGIGALTALVLAKMGVGYLNLYDDDTVDEVNLATQFHRLSNVGRNKGMALEETIQLFADDTMTEVNDYRVDDHIDKLPGEIIISAVDSIFARKDIWKAAYNSPAHWYLDARMAAEQFRLNTIDLWGNLRLV